MGAHSEEGREMGTQLTTLTALTGLGATAPRRRSPRPRSLRALGSVFAAPSILIGVPAAGSEDFRLWSEWIGRRLAESGPAGIEAHLAAFAGVALDLGVEPVHAHVVADRDMPQLARARAFFKVATSLNDDPGPSIA
jgi:hypothetical protein